MSTVCESELMFTQYAQDPYEGFSELMRCKTPTSKKDLKEKKPKQRRRDSLKKPNHTKSFVMSRVPQRGIKLIKISVIDLCKNNAQSDSDNESENIVISAQYIVKDSIDSVMDETESLVKKISKCLIDNEF